MDEVSSIIQELSNIINELEGIESDLRTKFKGINTEKCAEAVRSKINQYYTAKSKLQTIDRSQVDE